ncbi:hypothetical protein FRB96_008035 [Tulasnella sp. 330]|nr:hypothetical protein FRB96_008035 [Tulasnella sp. 330]KAG8878545.1 hypothetical protein FRB97_002414 [Tulasnella sp. 331]KAG8885473.1 hypothetical protein FRB98_001786 [Tulasnella sp. 332]
MLPSAASSTLRWIISLALFLTLANATGVSGKTPKRHENNVTRRAVIPASRPVQSKETQDDSASSVICRAEGLCERCPESSIHEPFCQPYGNRRLIKCLPNTEENARLMRQHAHDDGDEEQTTYNLGETPAWEACGKVIVLERADYWEFLVSFRAFVVVLLSRFFGGYVVGASIIADPPKRFETYEAQSLPLFPSYPKWMVGFAFAVRPLALYSLTSIHTHYVCYPSLSFPLPFISSPLSYTKHKRKKEANPETLPFIMDFILP